jgi:hypothetical protein
MKKIVAVIAFMLVLMSASGVKAQLSSITNPLNLENVTTVPGTVYVGSNFVLYGTIRNAADRSLFNIIITVQGGFPFSKTSPLTSFDVGTLAPNKTFQFSIPLSIDNDATNQQYSLMIRADYSVYDPAVTKLSNVVSSQTMTATVKVEKGADIEIVNATFPQKMVADAKGAEVIVYVTNLGVNSAEQVEFNLAAEYPFTPTGRTFFISEIKPGDTAAAEFHVDVDSSAAAQTFPLDMTINWKEGNNQYSDTKTFGIPVGSTSLSISVSSFVQSNLWIVIVVIIVLVAVVFIFFRKKMKRKAK